MKTSRRLDPSIREVTVFAPATVANVAVGFDILGFALEGLGDTVTVTRTDKPGIRITSVTPSIGIPIEPSSNTAAAGMLQLISDHGIQSGFELAIEKGIPLSSGMGGSAASAVAGLVALNAFLEMPLSSMELLHYCVIGESVASGARHGDNVAPSLLGGFQLVRSLEPIDVIPVPVPKDLFCVLVHPALKIETKVARGILQRTITLKDYVHASAELAAVIAACHRGDYGLLERSLKDHIIEPQRSAMISGFYSVKDAALASGAIGCSISGAGPTVFAWTKGEESAKKTLAAMSEAFTKAGVKSQGMISRVGVPGARTVRKV